MNAGYEYLIAAAPVLHRFADNPDPARLARALDAASSGESVMIRAALSLVPEGWLPEEAAATSFRLAEVGSLDWGNASALLEALKIPQGG